MRWEILNKAWKLARDKFPDVKNLYVDLPYMGNCDVYRLDSLDEPIAKISYSSTSSKDGRPVISVELSGNSEHVAGARVNRQYRTSISHAPALAVPDIDIELMRKTCRDGFELGEKLALLFSSGKDTGLVDRQAIARWLSSHGANCNTLVPVAVALSEMGFDVTELADSSFNLKTAKGEQKFEEHQRVRVIHPTSMEYQECGRVLGIKGRAKDGFWYAVLVDGSEEPIWFPEDALDDDEAGKVVDPIVEPIDE